MAKRFNRYFEESLNKISPALNQAWVETAVKHGWEKSIYSNVAIVPKGSSIVADYPDELGDKVFDSEYGAPGSRPRPALRDFAYSANRSINRAAFEAFSRLAKDKGITK